MSTDHKFTILHPIPDYSKVNTKKGVSQYALPLAKKGHDVEIIIYENENTDQIDLDCVEIRQISADGIWKILSIIPILLTSDSDVFVTQFFGRKDLVWAPICWIRGIKYTIMFDYTPQGSEISSFLYYWIKLKLFILSVFVEHFFAKTVASKNELSTICPLIKNKIEVLPSGLENKYFRPGCGHTKTIVYVGRLVEDKNVDLLIESFNDLKYDYPEWELEIAGDGPKKYNIDDLDRVTFRGYLNEEPLLELYSRADILCLPSLHESFSNVLIEAAASETAIISTNVGIAPKLLDDSGIIIERNSNSSLRDALEHYMNNVDELKKDAENLRTKAEAYRLTEVVSKLENLI